MLSRLSPQAPRRCIRQAVITSSSVLIRFKEIIATKYNDVRDSGVKRIALVAFI